MLTIITVDHPTYSEMAVVCTVHGSDSVAPCDNDGKIVASDGPHDTWTCVTCGTVERF